jgi:hypothetical protein
VQAVVERRPKKVQFGCRDEFLTIYSTVGDVLAAIPGASATRRFPTQKPPKSSLRSFLRNTQKNKIQLPSILFVSEGKNSHETFFVILKNDMISRFAFLFFDSRKID